MIANLNSINDMMPELLSFKHLHKPLVLNRSDVIVL